MIHLNVPFVMDTFSTTGRTLPNAYDSAPNANLVMRNSHFHFSEPVPCVCVRPKDVTQFYANEANGEKLSLSSV